MKKRVAIHQFLNSCNSGSMPLIEIIELEIVQLELPTWVKKGCASSVYEHVRPAVETVFLSNGRRYRVANYSYGQDAEYSVTLPFEEVYVPEKAIDAKKAEVKDLEEKLSAARAELAIMRESVAL